MPIATRGTYSPPDGKAMLEHVLSVVFKQPKDSSLAKALDEGGICDIFGVLSLSQSDHSNLTYVEDGGTVKPISIGHKGMLKTLKLFAAFCKVEGHPIVDWTQVTKKDFDKFRSSNACISATEMDDNIALPTRSDVSENKVFGDSRSGYTCVNPTEMDDSIMLPSSSSAGQNIGDSMSGNACVITTVNHTISVLQKIKKSFKNW